MPGLAVIQPDGLDVALQSVQPKCYYFLRRISNWEKAGGGLVDRYIGCLRRKQYSGEQLKHRGVMKFSYRSGICGTQGRKKCLNLIFSHLWIVPANRGL